ncbi:MAG: type II 3-dehydroquinate dehydratase, partial [Chloroflexota bacterium]
MSRKIFLLHGPNLNLLGTREPNIYGSYSLDDINTLAKRHIANYRVELRTGQSNHEG